MTTPAASPGRAAAPAVHVTTPDDDTVVAVVTVAAGMARAFEAFTDPGELAAWFWPERFATTYDIDLSEGGGFRIRSDVAGMGVSGHYLEVTPPTRLAMTWTWDDGTDTSEVAVEFGPAESGGTVVTVTHRANSTIRSRDDHAQGWADCLGRLVQHAGGA